MRPDLLASSRRRSASKDQTLGISLATLNRGDAQAQGQALRRLGVEEMLVYCTANLLCHRTRRLEVGAREQDEELVAAAAKDHLRLPNALAQELSASAAPPAW